MRGIEAATTDVVRRVHCPAAMRQVAFSPDGSHLLAVGVDGGVRSWRLPEVSGAMAREHVVATARDGSRFVLSALRPDLRGENNGRGSGWWTPRAARSPAERWRAAPPKAAVDPTGRFVAISTVTPVGKLFEIEIRLWDTQGTADRGVGEKWQSERPAAPSVASSPDGKRLVAGVLKQCGENHSTALRVYDLASGRAVESEPVVGSPDTAGGVSAVVWPLEPGASILLGVRTKERWTQHSHDPATAKPVGPEKPLPDGGAKQLTADGRYSFEYVSNRAEVPPEQLTFYERMTRLPSVATAPRTAAAIREEPSGRVVVTLREPGCEVVRITPFSDGQRIFVSFAPWLVFGQREGAVTTHRAYRLADGRELFAVTSFDRFNTCTFSPDGRRVLVWASAGLADRPRQARLLDADTGRELLALDVPQRHTRFSSAPTGTGSSP